MGGKPFSNDRAVATGGQVKKRKEKEASQPESKPFFLQLLIFIGEFCVVDNPGSMLTA